MGTPTVPFKVMAKGYTIGGGQNAQTRAVVPYLVAWDDAFTFVNQAMGFPSAASVGPIVQTDAYRFPPSPTLMASDFEIEPCGVDGVTGPMLGLNPGEFWTHAKITLTFGTPTYVVGGAGSADDPNNLQQLDPSNPLTYCTQSVRLSGRAETVQGGYELDDTFEQVKGPMTVIQVEAQLVLTFPRVPFLPWQKIYPYIGRVNDVPILGVPRGQLLLEGTDIEATSTSAGLINQSVQLVFSAQDHDWNAIWSPIAGEYKLAHRKAAPTVRIYEYKNMGDLFL
jgi:hypothetical protein